MANHQTRQSGPPTPPDPHVSKSRRPLLIVLALAVAAIVGGTIVMADRPGAGMGGSLSDESSASPH